LPIKRRLARGARVSVRPAASGYRIGVSISSLFPTWADGSSQVLKTYGLALKKRDLTNILADDKTDN
jgi:hypothetical protein